MRNSAIGWVLLAALVLAACGGGGGKSAPTTSQARPESVFISANARVGLTTKSASMSALLDESDFMNFPVSVN